MTIKESMTTQGRTNAGLSLGGTGDSRLVYNYTGAVLCGPVLFDLSVALLSTAPFLHSPALFVSPAD